VKSEVKTLVVKARKSMVGSPVAESERYAVTLEAVRALDRVERHPSSEQRGPAQGQANEAYGEGCDHGAGGCRGGRQGQEGRGGGFCCAGSCETGLQAGCFEEEVARLQPRQEYVQAELGVDLA
jgi:hypothetical protein